MTAALEVIVYGIPKPQGSKRAFVITPKGGGKPRAVITEDSRTGGRDWRTDVTNATLEAMPYDWQRLEHGVAVDLSFRFDRPRSHYRSGRNAALLSDRAPAAHTVKPDLDKLTRAILDALTSAGVYRDDSQVMVLAASKRYVVGNERPGVVIRVGDLAGMLSVSMNSAVPARLGEGGAGTADPQTDEPMF